jgi:hypothetical protein
MLYVFILLSILSLPLLRAYLSVGEDSADDNLKHMTKSDLKNIMRKRIEGQCSGMEDADKVTACHGFHYDNAGVLFPNHRPSDDNGNF